MKTAACLMEKEKWHYHLLRRLRHMKFNLSLECEFSLTFYINTYASSIALIRSYGNIYILCYFNKTRK